MTLASGYAPEIKNGNDSTTSFSFGFVVNKAADIQVTHSVAVGDGTFTDTVLTEGTGTSNYSVSSIVYPNSGSITYPALLGTELATGDKLTIARVVDLDQETNLRNQGKYKPEQVESMGDYDRMVDQQQQDQIDRSLKVPISDDSGADYTIPVPVAEKIFRWNAAGTALELVSLSDLSLALGTSFKWNFDTSTSMGDPGAGDVRFDNATLASVTNMAFSNVSAQSGNPDVSDFMAALGASDSAVKGHIALWKDGSAANYAIFSIDAAVTDNTSWLQASVVHIQSGGSFSASDSLVFMFARTGDKGDTGATGSTGSTGAAGADGADGSTNYDIALVAGYDNVSVKDDVSVRVYANFVMARSGSFTGESGYAETAPTGAALILDIEKNGTTIYATKPEFASTSQTLTAGTLKTDGTEDYIAGDRMTFKVTQIGSTLAGAGIMFTAKGLTL